MIKLKVHGLDDVLRDLKKSPLLFNNAMKKAVTQSGLHVKGEAQVEAPVDTSNLKNSMSSTVRKRGRRWIAFVQPNVTYALFVHEGTKPHVIRPKKKPALANKKAGKFFGKIVNHPGTKANRFMDRAAKNSENKVQSIFAAEVNKAIDKL